MINLNTKIEKNKLLSIIRTNKDKHISIYNEAIKEYKIEIINQLTSKLDKAKKHEDVSLYFNLTKPENRTIDYEKAIKMIELTEEAHIVLDPETFNCLINDEWIWKNNFDQITSLYLKK